MKLGKMQICYIAPVDRKPRSIKMYSIAPVMAAAAVAVAEDKTWVQEQVEAAINTALVDPLNTWAHNTWINFVDASFMLCLSFALGGAICGILGIKKGYTATKISILVYFAIRLLSYFQGWY